MSSTLSETNATLLQILRQAAADGAPCPSNRALCGRLGIHNYSLHKRLSMLVRRGEIETKSQGRRRRIRDVASGRWTEWSSLRHENEEEYEREAAHEALRKCLCCGVHFPSEGNHNRICSACKSTDAYKADALGHYSCGGVLA